MHTPTGANEPNTPVTAQPISPSCNEAHVCAILPPHILEAISAAAGAHPDARQAAQTTLMLTQTLRDTRHMHCASLLQASTGRHHHHIVPPYVLEAITGSESADQGAREGAQRTLGLTQELREERERTSEALLASTEAITGPPHLNRLVYNVANTERIPGSLILTEDRGSSRDLSVNECYKSLGAMFNFLSDIFQRNSIDDAGMNLMGSVHYGQKYNNAFWNGHQMVFGDGDGVYFNRFTVSLDIIGHELAHGITARTANLAYSGQSGALNESVSDVFGSMLKQYNLNQEAADADWLIGEGLYTSNVRGDALRSMKAPGTAYNDPVLGKDPQPATFDDFVATISDAGGVHINSGIPNHAFYLVAVAFGGYSWEKAGQIWYATLKDSRLQPNADFKAFANLTADNALKAFGDSAKDIVTQAWTDVGVF